MVTAQLTPALVLMIALAVTLSQCSPHHGETITGPTSITERAPSSFGVSAALDVTFPPRNEPFLFRTNLEAKYRDDLRRDATTSFVDIEGTIVWTQEYVRYRVNQCGHAEAVARVLRQI